MKHWLADKDEARRIPDLAALLILVGMVGAIAGFVAALFSESGFATLILTVGLILAAVGMRQAEKALDGPSDAYDANSANA
jgi:hypothetical protein